VSYEEKGTWVQLVVAVAVYGVYAVIVGGRLAETPVADVHYVATLLWTIGISIVAAIVARIAVEIARPSESHRSDARDREIDRHGQRVGNAFLIAAALVALAMSLAEWDHFWIANVLYLGFVASAVVGSTAKLVAYRRGL
jgi:cytochrome b561